MFLNKYSLGISEGVLKDVQSQISTRGGTISKMRLSLISRRNSKTKSREKKRVIGGFKAQDIGN